LVSPRCLERRRSRKVSRASILVRGYALIGRGYCEDDALI
jgi:hypothetical protein